MSFPTFWGGVHPAGNKDLTRNKAVESYLPAGELIFPMSQHIGAPNKPAVAKGDRVLVGTVLGSTDAFVSAPVLSSVSGTVKDIAPHRTVAGNFDTCVIVENDGKYEKDPRWAPLPDYENCDPKLYLQRIREAGIVGFGGATFPAAVKFAPPPKDTIKWLIANGAECEPYLNCDFRLMLEATDEIVKGMALLLRLFPEAKGIIAIENNKPEAIEAMNKSIAALGVRNLTVQPMTVKYPQGAEKMLIEALTGQEYVATALPADVGCIISNVRTVQQCWRAIAMGEPSTTRIVTVTGDAVKGTSGILALTEKSTMLKRASACLHCGRCVKACPMGLVPSVLDAYVLAKQYDRFEAEGGLNCIECGSCTYSCPACRPLTQSCRDGKTYIAAQRRKKKAQEQKAKEAAK